MRHSALIVSLLILSACASPLPARDPGMAWVDLYTTASDLLMAEPMQRTCELRVRYDNFAAGQRYRIEARTLAMSAQGWLYDDQRNVLARARVLRCGVF